MLIFTVRFGSTDGIVASPKLDTARQFSFRLKVSSGEFRYQTEAHSRRVAGNAQMINTYEFVLQTMYKR